MSMPMSMFMWKPAAPEASADSASSTPRQHQIKLRAASSLGQPASASLGQAVASAALAGAPHRPCAPSRQLRFAADQRAVAIANLAAMRGKRGKHGQAEGAPADGPESPDAPDSSYPKTEDGLFLLVPRLSP